MLFQGEEWAASSPFQYFANHEDQEMAKLVSEGRKMEFAAFGWDPASIPDPESTATFERSKLDWEELGRGPHKEMLEWYRALFRLRRSHISSDEQTKVEWLDRQWLSFTNIGLTIVCNLGAASHRFAVSDATKVLLASSDLYIESTQQIEIPPDSIVVLSA